MTVHELLKPISALSHAEKYRLVRFLLEQQAQEEGLAVEETKSSSVSFDPRSYFGAGRRSHQEIEAHLSEVREGCYE